MADIRPFHGLRYNLERVGSLADLVCPPYDVISSSAQQELYASSPHNIVRLEYAAGSDRYAEAGRLFREWRRNGILVRDEAPSLYLARHSFVHTGSAYTRYELTCNVKLEEFGEGAVLPHEFTSPGPKKDRLALMEACLANFSPLMALYRDDNGGIARTIDQVCASTPWATFNAPDNQSYEIWLIQSPMCIQDIQMAIANQPLYLADGHHRYETALWYRSKQQRISSSHMANPAYNFAMMTLISIDDPGLLVLPYHRLVGNMDVPTLTRLRDRVHEVFSFTRVSGGGSCSEVIRDAMNQQACGSDVLGLLSLDNELLDLLTLRDTRGVGRYLPGGVGDMLKDCVSWILQEVVLRPVLGEALEASVAYSHDADEAAQSVQKGDYQMAFFLPPMPMPLFERVSRAGLRLPPKSTFFHPKLPTGLVVNPLDGEL